MPRRIGLPLLALAAMLMFMAPSHADAKVHFGLFVGPAYPAYPYVYSYPYPYPYPRYYYYDPYYYPYAYSYVYPSYGYWGGGYYWRGHRDRDDYRGWGRGEHGFRGGGRGYGRGHGRGR